MLACHTCDNPPCVNPAHLFLGDDAANCADKVAKNRQARTPPHWGESSPNVKVNTEDVRQIRARYAAGGVSQRELGEEYGVTQSHISSIVRGACRRRG
jgi:predicted XRE-type DNA-binding protein